MAHVYIPEHITEDHSLSWQEKGVFGIITGLTKKEGYCYATNEFIGLNLEMKGDMVSKHISSLVKKGKIQVQVEKKKKGEGSPQEWGTRRKIYVFFQDHSDGCVIKSARGTEEITSNIEIEKNIEGETPPLSSVEGMYKEFSLKDQLQLLASVLGICEVLNYDALIARLHKSSPSRDLVQTAYQWLYQDCLDCKIETNYFLVGYFNRMPTTFEEAKQKMDERLIAKEKLEPGFISSHKTNLPKYDL
jgi:hypothetical protein